VAGYNVAVDTSPLYHLLLPDNNLRVLLVASWRKLVVVLRFCGCQSIYYRVLWGCC
jgi:hypothetical protein